MINANCYRIRCHFDFISDTTISGVADLCREKKVKAIIGDYDDDGYFDVIMCDCFNRQAYDVYGECESSDIKIIDSITVEYMMQLFGIDFGSDGIIYKEDFIIPSYKIQDGTMCLIFRKGAN